jgi:hypothetical protein
VDQHFVFVAGVVGCALLAGAVVVGEVFALVDEVLAGAMGVEERVADSTGEEGAVVKDEDGALVVGVGEQEEEEGASVVNSVARASGGADTLEDREDGVEEGEGLGGMLLIVLPDITHRSERGGRSSRT